MRPEPETLWQPPADLITDATLTRYARWLADADIGRFRTYQDLWAWSVDDLEGFWPSIWTFFDVPGFLSTGPVLSSRSMPGARWFAGSTLNYAEVALRGGHAETAPAIEFHREDGERRSVRRGDLAAAVGAAAAGLRRLGVGRGDRVAAYLPTVPEAVIGFLATASIGAVWSSCSPDFGARAVVDRFGQIAPKVLLAVTGYSYGGRWFDRRGALAEIVEALPGVTVVLTGDIGSDHGLAGSEVVSWGDLCSVAADPRYEPMGFEDPLWILYSSGTTGMPKSMVQGHGGIVLEHLKSLALHLDLGPDDRFCWYTTTGWMMWNFLVSGLLVGATVVLYDGSPTYPDLGALWRVVERAGITYLGSSAPFIQASMTRGGRSPIARRPLHAPIDRLDGGSALPRGVPVGRRESRLGRVARIDQRRHRCLHRRRDVVSMAAGQIGRDPVPGARREGRGVRSVGTTQVRRDR